MIDIKERIKYLKLLKKWITNNRERIYKSLFSDLNKSNLESEISEISPVIHEINLYLKNIKKWAKRKRVKKPIHYIGSNFYKQAFPYGKALLITPWNYPINISLISFINAFGAGNEVLLKPSKFSVNSSSLLKEIANEVFENNYLKVFLGEKEISIKLLEEKIDIIFFTGNSAVGKNIYKKAAEKMIPCILELGGKSPVIVDESANIEKTAKRIIFGKMLNAGQTCVAPDYVYVHKSIKRKLVSALNLQYKNIYGLNSLNNRYLPKIISENHFDRIKKFNLPINYNENRQIEFYIHESNLKDKIMQEEIFAPILPILEFNNLNEVIDNINNNYKSPLALYIFSKNNKNIEQIINNIQSGGVGINDTILQIANNNLGFGGVGNSGIGRYHGKDGFESFSQIRNIVKTNNKWDLNIRYKYLGNEKKKIKKIIKLTKSN
ncbi:NAD-dependent aldehyde dehydrogenase domain-containing protein [Mycoplasmopsis maculosa]|uniref:Aldehyde dehydrogenase n=1 Tax=Mycoplasmopsis maculosa TaxID=114885 RepID=A0A449B3T3_9BACT|nr:aldehyde dehydrogenase family protein [Mycoplasmopsis maculosa]VEU75264.1 NAD-dependent aldehyde dehydrogenase domain-containing protein [Mycoplasmopsis maculosa]